MLLGHTQSEQTSEIKLDCSPVNTCTTPNGRIFLFESDKISVRDTSTGLHISDIAEMCAGGVGVWCSGNIICVQKHFNNRSLILDSESLTILYRLPFTISNPIVMSNQLIGLTGGKCCALELDKYASGNNPGFKNIKTHYDKALTLALLSGNRLAVFSRSLEMDIAIDIFELNDANWIKLSSATLGKDAFEIIEYGSPVIPLSHHRLAVVGETDMRYSTKQTTKILVIDIEHGIMKTWDTNDGLHFKSGNPQARIFSSTTLIAYAEKHVCFLDVDSGAIAKGFRCEWENEFLDLTILSHGKLITVKYNWRDQGDYSMFFSGPIVIENQDIYALIPNLISAFQDYIPLPAVLCSLILGYCNGDFNVSQCRLISTNTMSSVTMESKTEDPKRSESPTAIILKRGDHPALSASKNKNQTPPSTAINLAPPPATQSTCTIM